MDRHGRRKAKAQERALELQQDLRDNALHYAAAGERVAAYSVALVDAAFRLWIGAASRYKTPKRAPRLLKEAMDDLITTLDEAPAVLEAFRGRLCLDTIDEMVAFWEDIDSDDDEATVEDQPASPTTAVPEAFRTALD